jgi:putative heme iron utilization protein
MKREEVYQAIDSERVFQDACKAVDNSHVVEDFPLGSALTAIQVKLEYARGLWYSSLAPHKDAMAELRKIAAICVQMGEQNEMPTR